MILPNDSDNNRWGGGELERELTQTVSSEIMQLTENDNLAL